MKKAIFLCLALFTIELYAASFSDYGIVFNKTTDGEKLRKKLEKVLNSENDSFNEDISNSLMTFHGARVSYIYIEKKEIVRLFLPEGVPKGLILGNFKILGGVRISFRKHTEVSTFSSNDNKTTRFFFNNIELVGDNGIFVKDGTFPPSAFSAAKQKVGNFEIYQNQPLFFKSNGELIPIDHIRYRGKDYFFKDMQKDGVLPIDTHFASYNDSGAIARLYFEGNVERLGNKCWGCEYVLCLEKDHFYVYEISEIHTDNKLVIHGRPVKDKGLDYGALYYTDGDSQVAYVWRTDTGSSLYKERCSHVKDGYWSALSVPRRFEEYQ